MPYVICRYVHDTTRYNSHSCSIKLYFPTDNVSLFYIYNYINLKIYLRKGHTMPHSSIIHKSNSTLSLTPHTFTRPPSCYLLDFSGFERIKFRKNQIACANLKWKWSRTDIYIIFFSLCHDHTHRHLGNLIFTDTLVISYSRSFP